ncbi:probable ribonuclease P protein subunit 3 [Stegodyphus dumicola]|uniref:probable ribonuclease P protein subunit 3 n=1 Tax=Stegodyphus dumicola TaxID=202533 RepID=UPI0015AD249E|nr:probable ribonuclease P protein subunit 3 [Stegodyphus dumicola]
MDLNIIIRTQDLKNDHITDCLHRAYDFGYECVAINTVIDSSVLSGKNITIPEPKTVTFTAENCRNFKIVNRLTAIIEDGIHAHHLLKSPIPKKYDLLALQPVNEKMLQHICSTLDVDIISLNLTEDMGYSLKRTYIGQAIEKSMSFEIQYSPCLRDQTSKRLTISNSQLLVHVSKSKNVIISSGATKPLELRTVEDVINLGYLFGFKTNQANSAVRKNGKLVLAHANTRRKTGCGFVSVSGICKIPKHQGWIIKACKVPNISETTSGIETAKKRTAEDSVDEELKKKAKLLPS